MSAVIYVSDTYSLLKESRKAAILAAALTKWGTAMAKSLNAKECRECGTRLAADNPGRTCSPCARSSRQEDGSPPALDDRFWDAPEVSNALASRDFGRLLRAYRKAHRPEITQAELGRWLGLTQGQISRIERSATAARDLGKLDSWARLLRIPQRCLWFTLSAHPLDTYDLSKTLSTPPSLPDQEGDDVRRRQFLRSASVGVASVGASLLNAEFVRTQASQGRSAVSADFEIREMTQTFRRLDNRYGGGHSLSIVTSYLKSIVEPQLKQTTSVGDARGELFTAAAEMHQLAGWMSYDTGQAGAGRRHLRQALRLCQEAGDEALAGEMMAGMSHHATFHGAPESAVDLAIAARQAAKRAGIPALRSEAAVMEAHGLALQGDQRACFDALREAEQAYNQVLAESPQWLSYFDGAYLAAKFAHTFRDLGKPEEAEQFARRSLEMSDGYERGRLFNTALLASTLADLRRVDEACQTGSLAVQMANSVRSVRSAAYLADLGKRLTPYRQERSVHALYEQMAEAGLPTP